MCSAEVGCWDLNRQPPARQSDMLPTQPRCPATMANHITGIVEPNQHKILIFGHYFLKKSFRTARIDQLANSNKAANISVRTFAFFICMPWLKHT